MMNFGNTGEVHKETIEDICGCNGKAGENGYCLLRDLMLLSGPDDRTLEQLFCIKIFKYSRGISGKDNGWQEAMRLWRDEKHAQRFAEVYKPGMKAKDIYNLMFPGEPK
jgi:hypothetical protein